MTQPTEITTIVHGHERTATVYDDGHHYGECVVTYNDDRGAWAVLCPCGHFRQTISNPTGFYGVDWWRGRTIECEGSLPDRQTV